MLKKIAFRVPLIALLAMAAGCVVHPDGERDLRSLADKAGKTFTKTELPQNATPEQLVEFAMNNSGELQQRYWEWRSAIEQIPQDGSQTASLNLTAGATITRGRSGLSSTMLGLSNDPMTDIKVPAKLDAGAKQALQTARAAGQRFIKARFDLRAKVLQAYYDYALNAQLIDLEQSNLELLQTMVFVTQSRNRAGAAGQQEVLKAIDEADLSRNDLQNMRSQSPAELAALNALLGRAADAPLPPPRQFPTPAAIQYSDDQLLDLAKRRNPELLAQADELLARQQAIRQAKLQYIPDFNLSGSTDLMGITQSILGQATIPLFRHDAIEAAIAQAQANLKSSQSMRRQAGDDLAAQMVADLATLRDADRQLLLFEQTIEPRAQRVVDLDRSAYEAGRETLLDLLDSQRFLISIRRLAANLKAERGKRLADIEAIAAVELNGERT
ncbi:MAG: TolC family protein [Tepidisphaeraceae bacterium]|jgi:outer membrane protein TolC